MPKSKAPAHKSWRHCTVIWDLNFPGRRKRSVSYSVSFTRCILDISTLSSAPVARLTSCISLWVLTIPATAHCSKTAPCRSSQPCRIVCAGYCRPLSIKKISAFMLLTKRAWNRIHTAGMCGATASKSLWPKKAFSRILSTPQKKPMRRSIWNIWGSRRCWSIRSVPL